MFYLSVTCLDCGNEVMHGPCVTLLEHRGVPVVPGDLLEHECVTCDRCGTVHYFGELEVVADGSDVDGPRELDEDEAAALEDGR